MINPKLYILCVEDEPEVMEAILRDLAPFEPPFLMEGFSSTAEAKDWLVQLDPEHARVALLLCDHVMPGQRGVDFLCQLKTSELPVLKGTRRALFTGQAGQKDTITAINEGGIHHYIAKPWDPKALQDNIRQLLTDYVTSQELNPLPLMPALDQARMVEHLHDHNPFEDA